MRCSNIVFSFLLNNVFVAAIKPNTQKQSLFYFVRFLLTSPKQFSTLILLAPIKNIKQNIREKKFTIQCWFYETGIKILSPINKAQLQNFANVPPKFNADSVKRKL